MHKKKRTLLQMPDETALAAVSNEERAATRRVQDRLQSHRNIKFKNGKPVPRADQPEALPYITLADITKSGDTGAAMAYV